jgi:cell wall-associated NlpC family hydrolase
MWLALGALGTGAWAQTIAAIRPGDEGTAVEVLQTELQRRGYYTYPDITGYYGAETELAVQLFQGKSSLGRDGVAGKYTLQALFGRSLESVLAGTTLIPGNVTTVSLSKSAEKEEISQEDTKDSSVVEAKNLQSEVLRAGMTGGDVRALQERLVALGYLDAADGDFGSDTERAVKVFQTASGLGADGQAGVKTLAALTAVDAPPHFAVPAPASDPTPSSTKGELAVAYAREMMGKPYVYGTAGPDTFDCSGLVKYVYQRLGVSLPHTSRLQGDMGTYLSIDQLRTGDLVFFDTIAGNGIRYDHVGIYISSGQFIHASSGSVGKVTVSSLTSGYYRNTFICGRRML